MPRISNIDIYQVEALVSQKFNSTHPIYTLVWRFTTKETLIRFLTITLQEEYNLYKKPKITLYKRIKRTPKKLADQLKSINYNMSK